MRIVFKSRCLMARKGLLKFVIASSMTSSSLALFTTTPANAQSSPPVLANSAFERDRNVSVLARPRPEYENRGIRRGAFIWRPSLTGNLAYSDNVFAAPEDKEGDAIVSLKPSLLVESDWTSNQLEAFATLQHQEFVENGSESATGYALGASGRLDVSRATYVRAGGDYRRAYERRTSIGANSISNEPIEFEQRKFFISAGREAGRVRMRLDADHLNSNFKDAIQPNGTPIDLDFRDLNQASVSGRVDYAISPETAVFARVGFTDVEHDQTATNGISRDRKTLTGRVGADFELSNLVRGQIGIGYFDTGFASADLSDVNGFGFDGRLEWFATPLITFTTYGQRGTRTSELLISPATTQTLIGGKADYEFKRNIIFSAGYDLIDDNYNFIDRTDVREDVYFSSLILFNPKFGLDSKISRRSLNSKGAQAQSDFNETRLLLGFKWQL